MDAKIKAVMAECTRSSDEERSTFPQVVKKLMEAGVERYHCDLCRAEKTYYMPNGESHVTPATPVRGKIPQDFNAKGMVAAVREIQAGKLTYLDFMERIAAAGCVGYFVSLAGRRAVYFGRTSECHVELFPGAR